MRTVFVTVVVLIVGCGGGSSGKPGPRDVQVSPVGSESPSPMPDEAAISLPEITNSIGMRLKLIRAGEFLMGSPETEAGRSDDEKLHRVRIAKAFYLGIHEVTRGQFAAFVKETGYRTEAESDGMGGYGVDEQGNFPQKPAYTWRTPGFSQTDEHPVVLVSWNDAGAFIRWLNNREQAEYRLPTEAEWEYACRAGTTTSYSNGDNPEQLALIGNIADASLAGKFAAWPWPIIAARDGYVFTAPVGSFLANGFGLHDMHGNVWEWCQDGYDPGAYNSRTGITADPFVKSGTYRVLGGGSWGTGAADCRAARRGINDPRNRTINDGFRVARSGIE